jgi:chromosome segregation ATPase
MRLPVKTSSSTSSTRRRNTCPRSIKRLLKIYKYGLGSHISKYNIPNSVTSDSQAAEDKVNHLNKVKAKLEQTLDELEDGLEREKKLRGDIEKSKRKIEGDLKLTQEAVADLERNKKELEQTIQRKDKEISSLTAKLEDEQSLVAKLQKQIKELQVI